MARKKAFGTCCLCLQERLLTFEHVPPEAAFNDQPVVLADINRLIGEDLFKHLEKQRGRQQQRGAGSHSLCEQCNNDTGKWYVRAYVDLVAAGMKGYGSVQAGEAVIMTATIRPLRAFKQMLTMFCSACGPGFARAHPGVPRYLLNRESRDLPPGIDIYLAFLDHKTMATRQAGISGRLDLEAGRTHTYAEISFPPYVLVMALGSEPPDTRLAKVTHFSNASIDDERNMQLVLHCVQTNTYLPADYSTRDQLAAISARRDAKK